jgi:hypothetical protein
MLCKASSLEKTGAGMLGSASFDDLRGFLVKHEPDAGSLFLPAMNLLFLLGLTEYRQKNDTFEYTGA